MTVTYNIPVGTLEVGSLWQLTKRVERGILFPASHRTPCCEAQQAI